MQSFFFLRFSILILWISLPGRWGQSLYRPAAGTLEEICGMSGLDLTGAYLKGVSLCRFVEGDGYYQRNLTDCTEQRWMDAQLPNSTAPILNDEYVVEPTCLGAMIRRRLP